MIRNFLGRWLALSLMMLGTLGATSARADWHRAESPLFIVYSDGKEDELKQFVSELHEYDALLRLLTGTTTPASPNKLPIYLVRNANQLREISPRAQRDIAGFYNSTPTGTLTVSLRQEIGGLPARSILLHEYAHHFMLHYHPAFYPAWYVEGFAEYFGATEFRDDVLNVGAGTPGRAWSLLNRPWAPIDMIIDPPNPRDVAPQFYEESWLTVSYFMSRAEGRTQLAQFLARLAQGEKPEAALLAATGMSFEALDSALRAYLKKGELPGFRVARDQNAAGANIKIETLSAANGAFLLTNARLSMNYDDQESATKLLTDLRRRAAKYAGDAFAVRTLAMAEVRAGDFDAAEATLAKLEALAPQDVNTPYLQALRLIEDGRAQPGRRDELWKQARAYAARAFRLDQDHYPSLYLYSLAALSDGQAPTENTVNALLRAYELAPLVEEIRLEAVTALLRTGKTDPAKQLLLPLAFAPHSKGGAEFARDLLNRVNTGETVAQPLGNYDCDCAEADAAAKTAKTR
jgi:hypothetical protein